MSLAAFFLAAAVGGCPITLTDVSDRAGLRFQHVRDATPAHRLPETMGSGIAWLDFDNDGWMDLYVAQSGRLPEGDTGRLYRNNGDGTFTDVTEKAKIATKLYGMGAIAADYDNDGFVDLFCTGFGRNVLYHNDGNGTFSDVTAKARVAGSGWSTSAAWADFDSDGFLDLFVTRYVDYSVEKDYFCGDVEKGERVYCHPSVYPGSSGILYHNNGDGTFSDITKNAGVDAVGKGLGVVILDFDLDGRPDIYVANDTVTNFLFHNLGHNRFEDASLTSGAGMSFQGTPLGGMGVDAGDLDGDGLPDIIVANFDFELNSFYRNRGDGLFDDVTVPSGFGPPSFNFLAFGMSLLDLDDRGVLDAYVANGHLQDPTKREGVTYAERDFLMWNDGTGHFHEQACGPAFDRAFVGRGTAVADYDNDGDPDIAVSNSGGPLQLLRNDGRHGHWLGMKLVGRKSNREGVGTRLVARTRNGRRLTRWACAGNSYLSSADPRILFGLGDDTVLPELTLYWPSGRKQTMRDLKADRYVTVTEPDER